MGVAIEEYRQRIGCFGRVLSSFRVRRNSSNLFHKQSKDFGTTLRVIIRCVDYTTKIQTSHCKHLLEHLQAHCTYTYIHINYINIHIYTYI